MLEPAQIALLAGAGLLAGAVNAVAGGGSLISFPALLAVGYPALTANVTNAVALTPGYFGGTLGYRRELEGQRRRILALGAISAAGAVLGAFLLVVRSAELFDRAVPFLLSLACGLLAAQARLARLVQDRREGREGGSPAGRDPHTPPLFAAQFLAAIYGAYFGAGVGIMMLAVLGILFADVRWVAVAIMAVTSLLGGQLGVVLARRLNDQALRWLVIAFGVAVGLRLLLAG